MESNLTHPVNRMKPQRGRRLDLPAPVMVVPARAGRNFHWRLVAFTALASGAAAGICAVAAQTF